MIPSLFLALLITFTSKNDNCDLKNTFDGEYVTGKHSDQWKFFQWKNGSESLLFYGEENSARRDDAEVMFNGIPKNGSIQFDTTIMAKRIVADHVSRMKAGFPHAEFKFDISEESAKMIGRNYLHFVNVRVSVEVSGEKYELYYTYYLHYGPQRIILIRTTFNYPELSVFQKDFSCILESLTMK